MTDQEPRGQDMMFDQWYGNRPANRKQVSREVWYAALAHAPELARLRAENAELKSWKDFCVRDHMDGGE